MSSQEGHFLKRLSFFFGLRTSSNDCIVGSRREREGEGGSDGDEKRYCMAACRPLILCPYALVTGNSSTVQ